MMTAILVSVGLGAVLGATLGWKMGRGYERIRPAKKAPSSNLKKKPPSSNLKKKPRP